MATVKFRQVHTSFWSDVKVSEDFTPNEKLMFLYLLTNDMTSITGCYETTKRKISYETGLSPEDVSSALESLEKEHMVIRFSSDTSEVLIENWFRYNWSKSPKLCKSVENYAKSIKNDAFREHVLNCLDGHIESISREEDEKEKYGIDTVSEKEKYGIDTVFVPYKTTSTNTIPSTIPISNSIPIPNSISAAKIEKSSDKAKSAIEATLSGICPECKNNTIQCVQGDDGNTAWECSNGCDVGWLDGFFDKR